MLTLLACETAPAGNSAEGPQDVEFLRGCWVAKSGPNGPVTGFLRLLPDGVDGTGYRGDVQIVTDGQVTIRMHLWFARDGSSMTIMRPTGDPVLPLDQTGHVMRPFRPVPDEIAAVLPEVQHRATYAAYSDQPKSPFMAAESDGDTLVIYAMAGGGQHAADLFDGRRDGCD